MTTQRLAILIASLVCCAGCGVGEYETRMKATQVMYERTEKFAQLYSPELVVGGNVSVRIPQFFNEPKMVEAPGAVQPNVQPGFPAAPNYKIPGLVFTYERHEKDKDGAVLPCYCYLAVVETKPQVQGQPGLSDYLAQQLTQAFPDQKPAWTGPEKCETDDGPLGQTIDWYKLSVTGEMFFDRQHQSRTEYVKQKGTFELWMYQAPDRYTVLLGWRIPEALEKSTPLAELKRRTAGTVKIKEPQAWPPDAATPLGNEATVGPYKLRVPANYAPKAAPFAKPGATILSWGAPGDAALMVVVAFPVDTAFMSNEQIIKSAIREINAQMQLTLDPVQHGSINGLKAAQARLASQAQPPMSGLVVCATDGAQPVVIFGATTQPGDPTGQLKQILAAALSLNRAK